MAEVGTAFVSILPSAKGFGTRLSSDINGPVRGVGASVGRTFGRMFVLGASVIAAAGLGNLLKGSIDEAREAQKVGAATEAIIKSTGGAAKITAAQVEALAGAISLKAGVDDEAVQTGANLLLTFKNVRNEVGASNDIFNRATQSAVDLSAAGFGSIDSASKSLGKALNDPVKGVTALSRAGVTFSESQKETIKRLVESGDVLGAQKIILKEVESQVGGVAAATATAGEKAGVAFGNIKEAIGTALIPVVDAMARAFTRAAPGIMAAIGGIGPTFSRIATLMRPGLTIIVGVLGRVIGQVRLFAAAVRANAVPIIQQLAQTFRSSILPALQRFGGFVQANVVPALVKIGGQIRSTVLPALSRVASFIIGKVVPVLVKVGSFIATNLLAPLIKVALAIATNVIPVVTAVVNALIRWQGVLLPIAAGIGAMVAAVTIYRTVMTVATVIQNAFTAALVLFRGVVTAARFAMMLFNLAIAANPIGALILLLVGVAAALVVAYKRSETFRAIVDKAFSVVKSVVSSVVGWFAKYVPQAFKVVVTVVRTYINIYRTVITTAFDVVRRVVGAVADFVVNSAQKYGQFVRAVVNKVQEVVKFFRELPGKIKGFLTGLPGELKTIGGNIIDGLKRGIEAGARKVLDAVEAIIDKIPKFIRDKLGISSPSKVTTKLGEQTGEGLAVGLRKSGEKVKKAAKEAVDKAEETLRDRLSKLRDTLSSISEGVSSNLVGNLFEATSAKDFIANLTAKRAELGALTAAFKTLKGWGLAPEFLSQLFQSGGAALILDLAAGGKAQAAEAASVFGQVQNLGTGLGNAVGQAEVGDKIDETNKLLNKLLKATGQQAVQIAQSINHPAGKGKRNRK